MEKHNRRKFLRDIALAGGAVTIATDALEAFSFFTQKGKKRIVRVEPIINDTSVTPVDFRYSPSTWQSTFCFPDDPQKSLVGKFGEMLFDHPGLNADIDAFGEKVWFGVKGVSKPEYIEQKIENAGTPIFVNKLKSSGVHISVTTFATNHPDEGRVDNVILEYSPEGNNQVECTPLITVTSKDPLELD